MKTKDVVLKVEMLLEVDEDNPDPCDLVDMLTEMIDAGSDFAYEGLIRFDVTLPKNEPEPRWKQKSM